MKTINVKFICSNGFSGAEIEDIREYEVEDNFKTTSPNIFSLIKNDLQDWLDENREDGFRLVNEDGDELEYDEED